MQAEQRLPPDLRHGFELLRMDVDTMQATLLGDIRDLRRLTVSSTDLKNNFANFVLDMESQLSQYTRSTVEHAQAVRNTNA